MIAYSCTFSNLNDGKCNIGYQSNNILQSSNILSDNTIQQVILKGKNNNYQMETNYADFAVVNTVNFPQKISMLITNPKTKVKEI